MLENKSLELAKIYTNINVYDMMTKIMSKEKHDYYMTGAGIVGAFHVG